MYIFLQYIYGPLLEQYRPFMALYCYEGTNNKVQ